MAKKKRIGSFSVTQQQEAAFFELVEKLREYELMKSEKNGTPVPRITKSYTFAFMVGIASKEIEKIVLKP